MTGGGRPGPAGRQLSSSGTQSGRQGRPNGGGINTALLVHRDRPTPVIVVSAYHEPETLALAVADNVMAYLVKPVKEPNLKAAITVSAAGAARLEAIPLRKRDSPAGG